MIGHYQIENITQRGLRRWRSYAKLRSSTGASGERDWHWNEWMPRLRDKLIRNGVQVYIAPAIWDDDIYSRDYDLWLSGHYDGGGEENRCMISAPNPTQDPPYLNLHAQEKAEEFCRVWKDVYPRMTGAINRDSRITEAMLDYYAFDYVPVNTPAVIVEHFNHTSPKGAELKANPDIVANADCEAIVRFLGLQSEQEEDALNQCLREKGNLEDQVKAQKKAMDDLTRTYEEIKGQRDDYQSKWSAANSQLEKYQAELNAWQEKYNQLLVRKAEALTLLEFLKGKIKSIG